MIQGHVLVLEPLITLKIEDMQKLLSENVEIVASLEEDMISEFVRASYAAPLTSNYAGLRVDLETLVCVLPVCISSTKDHNQLTIRVVVEATHVPEARLVPLEFCGQLHDFPFGVLVQHGAQPYPFVAVGPDTFYLLKALSTSSDLPKRAEPLVSNHAQGYAFALLV